MPRLLNYLLTLSLGVAVGGLATYAYLPANAQMMARPAEPMRVAAEVPVRRAAVGTPEIVGKSTIADLVERVDAAVVNIDTVARTQRDPFLDMFGGQQLPPEAYEEKGVGSGFVIDPNGLIVTNFHVVKGASDILVTTSAGKELRGKVIGSDPSTDLAIVKVNAKGLPALRFAPTDAIRVGDWVVAIGSPLGLSHTVSVGIVSALNRDVAITERGTFIQTDAAINPGNSGGPLLNMQGQVVGVNTAIAAHGQGIGFAIPSWIAQNVVDQLRTTGRVVRPYLGVSIRGLGEGEARGVQVVGVVPSGPAALAGLRPGDVITHVDGRQVESTRDLLNYLSGKSVGAKVQVTVRRDGQSVTRGVTLQAMPERPLR